MATDPAHNQPRQGQPIHRVTLEFGNGFIDGKLICPEDGCVSDPIHGCIVRTWFENCTPGELLSGTVTFEVEAEWTGSPDDGPTLSVIEPGAEKLDTGYHDRRLARRLREDPEFRAEYQRGSRSPSDEQWGGDPC